jgi:flagellar motility protein MotE (MotC chaperone)
MLFQVRLLPVLIFVAMLAFTVRLAEFATGISHLSGSAYAEEEKKSPVEPVNDSTKPSQDTLAATTDDKPVDQAAVTPPPASTEEGKTAEGDHSSPAKDKDPANAEGEEKPKPQEWRDAGDSDLDVASVKMEIMEDLSKRSAKLDAMEKNMKAREALLKATEQEIDRKYKELSKLRGEIEGLLGKQTEEEEKRVVSLVKIYEGMKPKDAARIFDTLDLDILVSVVSKMSERKIAAILGLMDPERAKTLTIMLLEQKKLPSLEQ